MHLGIDTHAARVLLDNKDRLSDGKAARTFETLLGIRNRRATSARSSRRTPRLAACFCHPTGARYVINLRRSRGRLADVIGWDHSGALVHDGWSPYGWLTQIQHQQCLRHSLNRGSDLLEQATAGVVRFPRAVRDVLGRALETRDRWLEGELTDHGRLVMRGRLRDELRRLVWPIKTHSVNNALVTFLERHLDE